MQNSNFRAAPESERIGFALLDIVALPVTVPVQRGRQSSRCSMDSDFPSWLMSFSFSQFSSPYDREAWSSHRDLDRGKKEKDKAIGGYNLFGRFHMIRTLTVR